MSECKAYILMPSHNGYKFAKLMVSELRKEDCQMTEYIITGEHVKEIVKHLPADYVPSWLYLWEHTVHPWVREKYIDVNLPEIVRCRDCDCFEEGTGLCNRVGRFPEWHACTEPDGFCKWCVPRKVKA